MMCFGFAILLSLAFLTGRCLGALDKQEWTIARPQESKVIPPRPVAFIVDLEGAKYNLVFLDGPDDVELGRRLYQLTHKEEPQRRLPEPRHDSLFLLKSPTRYVN